MKWIGQPNEWNYELALLYFGRTFLTKDEIAKARVLNTYEVLYTMNTGVSYIFNSSTTSIRRAYLSNEIKDEESFKREFMYRFRSAVMCSNQDLFSLSVTTDIAYRTIKRYNSGDTLPTAYNLYLIAKELECDVEELLPIKNNIRRRR